MGIFGIILLVFFAIVCALMIFMVIIQDQEGEGLGGLFGGAGNAAFGSSSTNIVVKFTYLLGTLFFVLAFSLAVINKDRLGDVEAAAIRQSETGIWFDDANKAAELLEGVEPAISGPQDNSILQPPATTTTGTGD